MESREHARPLLLTQDPVLREEVQRISAVAGVEVIEQAGMAEAGLMWATADLVLIGEDALADVLAARLSRRAGVVVVALRPAGHDLGALWRDAVALGAEHVVAMPDGAPWLVERLGELADGPARAGSLIVITSASGGCGVSTLAYGLAAVAEREGQRTMLVDGDRLGGGLDLLLGAEDAPGVRWADLADVHGRLSVQTLDYALPRARGLALLAYPRSAPVDVAPAAREAVLAASRRAHDVCVFDLPRLGDEQLLVDADHVVLVVPASVRGVAAGRQAGTVLAGLGRSPTIVVRRVPRGLPGGDVRQALGAADLLVLPEQAALRPRADQGAGFETRDAYGKAVAAVWRHLRDQVGVAS